MSLQSNHSLASDHRTEEGVVLSSQSCLWEYILQYALRAWITYTPLYVCGKQSVNQDSASDQLRGSVAYLTVLLVRIW